MTPAAENGRGDVASGPTALFSLAGEWQAIYGGNRRKSPFNSLEYVRLWYECFSRPEQVRIYRATCRGETVGFLPLVLQERNRIRTLTGLTNSHSHHSCALVSEGYENLFPHSLARALHHDDRGWDMLSYGCCYSFSALPRLLSQEGVRGYGMTLRHNIQPTYSVALHTSFEEYFNQNLTSKTRNCLRKYAKRLAAEGSARYLDFRGDDAVKRFDDFLLLEDSGWKGSGGSSILKQPAGCLKYYQGLTRLLAETDALGLYFLECGGKLIAGLYGYEETDTFHSLKIAYDEDFSPFAPSNLLFLHVVEALMTHRPHIRRFHMFPSEAGYKHRFANEEARCEECVLFSSTLRGRAMQRTAGFKEYIRELPGVRPLLELVRERCR